MWLVQSFSQQYCVLALLRLTTPPHLPTMYVCVMSVLYISCCVSILHRLQLRKWYAELLLSRKSQLEPSSDLDGDFPQSEVTLVADHATNQNQFKSFLQQSTPVLTPQGDKPAPDQGVELIGVVPTMYNEYKDPAS